MNVGADIPLVLGKVQPGAVNRVPASLQTYARYV